MKHNHEMENRRVLSVTWKQCSKCGAAIWDEGVWWFAGAELKAEPECKNKIAWMDRK